MTGNTDQGTRSATVDGDRSTIPQAHPEQARHPIDDALDRKPAADVRVRLFSLEEGDAEIQVAIDPDGPLAAAWSRGEARADAYDLLLDALVRELDGALALLAEDEAAGGRTRRRARTED